MITTYSHSQILLSTVITLSVHLFEKLNCDENGLPVHMPFGRLQVLHQGEQQAFQLVFHESMAKYPENLQNEVLSAQLVG